MKTFTPSQPDMPRDVQVPMPPERIETPPPPPPRVKGNGVPAVKDPRDAVERGLLQFDVLLAERDRLQRDLDEARVTVKELEAALHTWQMERGTIEVRIDECVRQRDEAVRAAGELRGALNSVAAICVRYHDGQQQD